VVSSVSIGLRHEIVPAPERRCSPGCSDADV
jgi:hypothetical protein